MVKHSKYNKKSPKKQKDRVFNDSLNIPKYVVYQDNDYPTSWIKDNNSDEIVEYLTDNQREKQFIKLNANELRNWMEALVNLGKANGHVVVFSQDVVPSTVFYDKSDALIRRYLHKGGRAVWIGDIPFFIYGKKKSKITVQAIINNQLAYVQQDAPPDGMRFNDIFSLLGVVPSFAFSEYPVEITNEAVNRGFNRHKWFSIRPIHPRYLYSRLHPFKRKAHVLANSKLTKTIREIDINPQRARKEKDESAFASIKGATEFLYTYFSLPAVIFGLLAFLFGGIAAGLHLSNLLNFFISNSVGILLIILILSILALVACWDKIRKPHFASAWIKDFNNGGEFIRIWDYNPEKITESMKVDLYQIAIYNI